MKNAKLIPYFNAKNNTVQGNGKSIIRCVQSCIIYLMMYSNVYATKNKYYYTEKSDFLRAIL